MCLQDDNDEDYDPNDDVKTENKMDTSDTPIDYNEDGENDDMLEDEDYIMPEKKKKKVKGLIFFYGRYIFGGGLDPPQKKF